MGIFNLLIMQLWLVPIPKNKNATVVGPYPCCMLNLLVSKKMLGNKKFHNFYYNLLNVELYGGEIVGLHFHYLQLTMWQTL